jgi:hypothetical protein
LYFQTSGKTRVVVVTTSHPAQASPGPPFASRRTVVRGSFGLHYDRVPLHALANALLSSRNTTTLLVNFTTMNPHMQNAYSVQGSFETEQQLGERSTLGVGYQHRRGLHLIVSVNQNVLTN